MQKKEHEFNSMMESLNEDVQAQRETINDLKDALASERKRLSDSRKVQALQRNGISETEQIRIALQLVSQQSESSIPIYLQRKIDPDRMTYEQLLELQELVGHVNIGLTAEQIHTLDVLPWEGHDVQCAICQIDITEGEIVKKLPRCEHVYHTG